jgi:hypothetical protein
MSHQCYGRRCEAISGRTGVRCRARFEGVVDGVPVCRSHMRCGFIPCRPDEVGDEQRARALRVLEMEVSP